MVHIRIEIGEYPGVKKKGSGNSNTSRKQTRKTGKSKFSFKAEYLILILVPILHIDPALTESHLLAVHDSFKPHFAPHLTPPKGWVSLPPADGEFKNKTGDRKSFPHLLVHNLGIKWGGCQGIKQAVVTLTSRVSSRATVQSAPSPHRHRGCIWPQVCHTKSLPAWVTQSTTVFTGHLKNKLTTTTKKERMRTVSRAVSQSVCGEGVCLFSLPCFIALCSSFFFFSHS